MPKSLRLFLAGLFIPNLFGCGIGFFTGESRVPSALLSTLEVTSANPTADGETAVTVRIRLLNSNSKAIQGLTPQYTVSGLRNTVTQNCAATDADGWSLCESSLISSFAETKTLSLTSPASFDGGTVTFATQSRGYNVRRCGFDMNRNGVRGESGDCRVCDGVTNDPDSDGTNEDMLYVDSVNGNDGTGTGSPSNPYQTVAYALTQADGPGDGAEDILCVSGTFTGAINPTTSGRATTYTVDGLLQPRDPLMIVGWDKDGDGVYPPLDPDDTAVFDGTSTTRWFWDNTTNESYVELAHLTIRRYGDTAALGGGVWRMKGGGTRRYFSFHDMEFESINDGLVDNDVNFERQAFSADDQSGIFGNVLLINNFFDKVGGSFLAVNRLANTWTNLTIESNTFFHNTAPGEMDHIYVAGVVGTRILKNRMVIKSVGWNAATDAVRSIHLGSCTQDMIVRDNDFIGVSSGLRLAHANGTCTPSANTDNVIFDRNQVVQALGIEPGVVMLAQKLNGQASTATNTIENVTITNNYFLSSSTEAIGCFYGIHGNDATTNPGTVRFVGNTCIGPFKFEYLALGTGTTAFPEQNYTIQNNIFSNPGAMTDQITTDYVVTGFVADGNVFDPVTRWTWNSVPQTSLSAWQTASGGDAASRQCNPDFVDTVSSNYRLASTDTCARNQGIDITAIAPLDYDGDARSAALPDIGADEIP
jgi:hypothetical protein